MKVQLKVYFSCLQIIKDNKVWLFQIGGRVKDVQFGGITVELGANWVHRLQTMMKTTISDKINQSCSSMWNIIKISGQPKVKRMETG